MKTNYAGIDYGSGKSNIDEATGIRFGVIAQNSLSGDAMEDVFQNSRDLSYEAAVNDAKDSLMSALDNGEDAEQSLRTVLDDFVSRRNIDERVSEMVIMADSDQSKLRESVWDVVEKDFNDSYECDNRDWLYEKDGYVLSKCLDFDVFVSKSPYYTYAQWCSPCVPGAGNLDSPFEPGTPVPNNYPAWGEDYAALAESVGFPKTYCLGLAWFDEYQPCPYPVFSVETGNLVTKEEKS